jgi:hypothetical protein
MNPAAWLNASAPFVAWWFTSKWKIKNPPIGMTPSKECKRLK